MAVTLDKLVEEITRLTENDQVLIFQCAPITAFSIVALLQLALRHPDLEGFNRTTAQDVVDDIQGWFEEIGAPLVVEAIDQGKNPANDVGMIEPRIVIP